MSSGTRINYLDICQKPQYWKHIVDWHQPVFTSLQCTCFECSCKALAFWLCHLECSLNYILRIILQTNTWARMAVWVINDSGGEESANKKFQPDSCLTLLKLCSCIYAGWCLIDNLISSYTTADAFSITAALSAVTTVIQITG